ncbi:MAG TPA: adenylate/guanylate cyclase domain-containing protein, partial [Candidatus Limnocylindrales bacterium]|nr:adenylate/guanylate cyclase domain-containing protein [Candidatus Limnocylindrales bacterium]
MTALFADLVDYVRLVAEHDPEEVRRRVDLALAAMVRAIAEYGGTHEKFIGDAVFAVFGWPAAHDDDALREGVEAEGFVRADGVLGTGRGRQARPGAGRDQDVLGADATRADRDAVRIHEVRAALDARDARVVEQLRVDAVEARDLGV